MLKIFSQFVSLLSRVFLKISSFLGKNLWLVFFKRILVPFYKVFLFAKRQTHKIFFEDALTKHLVTYQQSFRQRYLVHAILLIIFSFVLVNNFSTKNAYADEFNKKSILAQIFIAESEEEIIEKALPQNKQISGRQKTETIAGQLSAIENKKNVDSENPTDPSDSLALLSSSGEALIKNNTSPFAPADNSTAGSSRAGLQTYTVAEGDTLSSIATRFNISINTLLWENNLSLNSYIRPGEKLTILPTNGISYTIKAGDTLGAIAKRYNIDIDKILSYNNIADAGSIKIKQKIVLPEAKPLSTGRLATRSSSPLKNLFSGQPAPSSDKSFLWPSTSKRITQYFSWRHTAIDIGAKTGTPIYAMKGGRIERAGWSTGYGYNIVINHGNGVKSLYGHASKLYVKVGDQITQGEVIGAVGSTGWSTGPHIHLEIIINGAKANPLSYL